MPRSPIAFLSSILFLTAGSGQAPPAAPEVARLVIRGVTAPIFDGAKVSVSADPAQVRAGVHRCEAVVEGQAFELVVPGTVLPEEVVVAWSPRVRQTFALRTEALAAAVRRGTGGTAEVALQLTRSGPMPAAQPAAGEVMAAGRFGGRRDGKRAPEVTEAMRAAAAALDRGVGWLEARQQEDGGWPAGSDGDPRATADSRCLATAAACMALLGSGNSPASGPHRAALMRGVCWLVEQTDARTGRIPRPSAVAPLEEQALVALALGEARLLANFEPLREPAAMAAGAVAAMLGDAADRDEPAALGFAMLALASGRDSGVAQPEASAAVAEKLARGDAAGGGLRDAAALFAGVLENDPSLADTGQRAARLLGNLPAPGATLATDYVYFGSMAMWLAGEPHWSEWRQALATRLAESQIAEGALAGSWKPTDPAAQQRGRIWTTALRVLSLQVIHRLLRIERK